jgi:Tfp pilus assembly protein PilX
MNPESEQHVAALLHFVLRLNSLIINRATVVAGSPELASRFRSSLRAALCREKKGLPTKSGGGKSGKRPTLVVGERSNAKFPTAFLQMPRQ